MTKTIVVAGGTDGMGRGVALARAARGDTVVAIGSNAAKGRALPAGIRFLRADLTSIDEVERVVEEIADEHVDALVLTANRYNPDRVETADGLESTFAVYYLSRFLLAHGLSDRLGMVVAFAAPGMKLGKIFWADPQLTRGYTALRAQLQAGRMNDLLGVAFAEETGVPFVLYHPGFTETNAISQHRQPMRAVVRLLEKVIARPVERSVRPVVGLIDAPPTAPLTAIDRGKPVDLGLRTFDPDNARRLAAATRELLSPARRGR
jgi:NAD(P)-dependent dehydrogenase (short-subunit alcohol dehydrogenase family)